MFRKRPTYENLDMDEKERQEAMKLYKKKSDKSLLYDLYAISNHSGGLNGGHYTACVKNFKDGKWYNMNDSSVSESYGNLCSGKAYVLFYKKQKKAKLTVTEIEVNEEEAEQKVEDTKEEDLEEEKVEEPEEAGEAEEEEKNEEL